MRYSYYNRSRKEADPRLGKLLRYLLYVVTLLVLGLAFTVYNRIPHLDPETAAREAFFEGYFTLNSRLNRVLQIRFPVLKYESGALSDDGQVIHRFTIQEPGQLRPRDVRQVLKSSLEGYGFSVHDVRITDDHWEYQLMADTTVWSIYVFDQEQEQMEYADLLPKDLQNTDGGEIAIVIDDFGYAINDVIEGFVRLPETYTAAIIPGRAYSRQLAEKHYSRGRETLIHMPMVAVTGATSEPELALADSQSVEEIQRRLNAAARSVPYAKGMNNHQGSGGTQSRKVMETVSGFLKRKGMFFLDSRTIASTIGEKTARATGLLATHRDVFLDEVDEPESIGQELFRLARLSAERGSAIGIGHCRSNTLEALQKYLPALEEAGFEFVPVSSLARNS